MREEWSAGRAPDPSRRARWAGLVRLSLSRVRWRVLGGGGEQTLLSVLAVAVAVALLLLVTGLSLGLLGATTQGTGADYWVVPEGGASSAVVGVEGQRLGRVHPTTDRIERIEGVTGATPVLLTVTRTNRSTDAESGGEYVLAVGVIPPGSAGVERVAGLSVTDLTPGDPYYANGSYDGRWTGEAVVSDGAASALGIGEGDAFRVGSSDERPAFRVRAVREAGGVGIGRTPVVVVHLAELQRVVGATGTDSADQILVTASDPAVERRLAGIYPRTDVLTQQGLVEREASTTELPVVVAGVTLGVTVVIGALFVVTSLGFEVAESAGQRAVMASIGVSRSSRAILIATEALVVALAGGVVGIGLWLLGLPLVNALAGTFGGGAVAVFHPYLLGYGLGVALCIGLFTVPYLLVLGDRTTGGLRLGE